MAVDGIEIAVGQKWVTRGGQTALVESIGGHGKHPISCVVDGGRRAYKESGQWGFDRHRGYDLVRLHEDVELCQGVKLKAGQTWKTRGGDTVVLGGTPPDNKWYKTHPFTIGGGTTVSRCGEVRAQKEFDPNRPGLFIGPSDRDLVKFIEPAPGDEPVETASSGWIEHTQGGVPDQLNPEDVVEYELRDGTRSSRAVGMLAWDVGGPSAIIGYRKISAAVDQDGWLSHTTSSMPDGLTGLDRVLCEFRGGGCAISVAGDLTWGPAGDGTIIRYRKVSPDDQPEATAEASDQPGTAKNPKDAIGAVKLPLHLWPAEATALGCLGMLEGELKYGRNNMIAGEGVIASIYIAAAKRHLDAWFAGEECAPDTGTPHLANALATIAIIVKTEAHGKLIDDRDYAPNPGYRSLVDRLTPHVARLKSLFADKKPRHYTIADNPKEAQS